MFRYSRVLLVQLQVLVVRRECRDHGRRGAVGQHCCSRTMGKGRAISRQPAELPLTRRPLLPASSGSPCMIAWLYDWLIFHYCIDYCGLLWTIVYHCYHACREARGVLTWWEICHPEPNMYTGTWLYTMHADLLGPLQRSLDTPILEPITLASRYVFGGFNQNNMTMMMCLRPGEVWNPYKYDKDIYQYP